MASAWQYSVILGLFGVLYVWLRLLAQPKGAVGGDQGPAPHEAVVTVVNGQAITAQELLEHVRGDILAMAGQMRLQDLSRKLLEAQETERRRIAHELHDEAGQLLASIHLALETTISGLPPQFRDSFHQVRSHLDAIETQLRCLAHELRPTILDDLGLLPALQDLAHRVAERTGLCIHVDSVLAGRLAPAVEMALYRIMQEGLTNIAKHAVATHVDIQLWRDEDRVHGLLRDDGVGFAVERVLGQTRPRGLGFLGIQERLEALGGTLKISSVPGQGTTLQITLPAAGPDPVAGGALAQGRWPSIGVH